MAEADYTLAQASAAASALVIDRVTILGVVPQACSALQCTSQRSTICHSRCKLRSSEGLQLACQQLCYIAGCVLAVIRCGA